MQRPWRPTCVVSPALAYCICRLNTAAGGIKLARVCSTCPAVLQGSDHKTHVWGCRCVGAELHFTLPPSYPSSRPASCHVRGDASIPRALADAWTAALQEVASQQVRVARLPAVAV